MKVMTRRLPLLAALAVSLVVSGCGGGWLGGKEEPPLPGARVDALQPDPGLIRTPETGAISLPKPWNNRQWPNAGGYPSHAMQHLSGGDLTLAWTANIGEGGSDERPLLASPVVADGVIYTLDADYTVMAHDITDGRRRWHVSVRPPNNREDEFGGGLSIAGPRLIAGTGFGELVALDRRNGKILWRTSVDEPVRTGPTVAEGRVYVLTVADNTVALDVANGRQLWRHSGLLHGASLLGGASPAVGAGTVLSPHGSGDLYAIDADTGVEFWTNALGGLRRSEGIAALDAIAGRPVVDRGLVVAGTASGHVAGIDLRTGVERWAQNGGTITSPWVAGDWVFIVTPENKVAALDRDTGRARWIRQLEQWEDPEEKLGPVMWTAPVVVGTRLVLANNQGALRSLSPFTGEVVGEILLKKQPILVDPVVAEGMLFVVTRQGTLVAYR